VVIVLSHVRRIVHFNITEHPTAEWTAQQVVDAFPDDTAPKWQHRDRDSAYGELFRPRVAGKGILRTAGSLSGRPAGVHMLIIRAASARLAHSPASLSR